MKKIDQFRTLAAKKGKEFWRSLEELVEDKKVQEVIRHEFPQMPSMWDMSMTRRTFLKLMGAQILMLALAGCTRKIPEKIVPYVKLPEGLVPGEPLFFATALTVAGGARGVVVESHMGRPTKIEGNLQHPDSLGRTDAVTQALIYQLYDPDRSAHVLEGGLSSTWGKFQQTFKGRLGQLKGTKGKGLRFLSKPVISPALADQRRRIIQEFPLAQWHQYTPLHEDFSRQAFLKVYGRHVQPRYYFQNADVVVSLGSDFLTQGRGAIAYAHDFTQRRGMDEGRLNRLYAFESTPTLTGAMADHRFVVHPDEMLQVAAALSGNGNDHRASVIADDLRSHPGRSLIVAGPEQPITVQMMALHLNESLDNVGKTVDYISPIEEFPEDMTASLQALVKDLNAGEVTDLMVLDANPVYASPFDFHFGEAFQKARFRVHLGLYEDETAKASHWHIPLAHELESWGDTKAFDGTISIRQPLIAPLYSGKTEYELASLLLGQGGWPPLEIVRSYWEKRLHRLDFDFFWEKTVHDGVMKETGSKPLRVHAAISAIDKNIRGQAPAGTQDQNTLALLIRPDPHILDGQFANNALLQELPKPLTRLTWDNAAFIAPSTAHQHGLSNGDVIEISFQGASLESPVWVLPGQAFNVVTIHLGYGRKDAGTIGSSIGFDAYQIQHSSNPYEVKGIEIRKTGKSLPLANTQHHGMLNAERHPVIVADLMGFRHDPDFVRRFRQGPAADETLYEPKEHLHGQYQWGMLIDLNRCIGCGACTMACQVENNIPVVGKQQVENHREMHWIRVDRYFQGSMDDPKMYHQPVPCMQCENAPCEVVCPVEATTHSEEGLNEMTYNRCIGTRYCSNNCPYKVRRFNFYEFSRRQKVTSLHLGQNPDVTVRSRGVMEKCTYCVQRIDKARIDAKKENRLIKDGEVIPACQQACPANAIIFGNIADLNSMVSRAKAGPLNYSLLDELGTRPRTTYLARITNPNPRL